MAIHTIYFSSLYQILNEQAHWSSSGALKFPAFPGYPGDIEMCPAVVFGEARKEAGSGDGPCWAATRIGKIGRRAFQLFVIFLKQGQIPGATLTFFACREEAMDQIFAVTHGCGSLMANGNNTGSCQCGHVDHNVRFKTFYVSQGVCEYQATVGVGVDHFDH